MTDVQLDYKNKLDELIEKWESTLTTDCSDHVHVDGEEGDFGIVRYYGPDHNGDHTHMITTYIHGGDVEHSYYTEAGAAMVKKIIMENFEVAIDKSLKDSIDPGQSEDLYHGFVKVAEKASDIAYAEQRKYAGMLHPHYAELFPKEMQHGAVYKFLNRFYVCVQAPEKPDCGQQMHFYDMVDPMHRLAIEVGPENGTQNKLLFFTSHDNWKAGFAGRKIRRIEMEGNDRTLTRNGTPSVRTL